MASGDGSSKTGTEKSSNISGDNEEYADLLEERNIFLADDRNVAPPVNLESFKKAMLEMKDISDVDSKSAKSYRMKLREFSYERTFNQVGLPYLLPAREFTGEENICEAADVGWSRNSMADIDKKPALTRPQPDMTYGWPRKAFGSRDAINALGNRAFPIQGNKTLVFPLFTIETKGEKGTLRVARLQNLHNAATMLSNLLFLWRNSGEKGPDRRFFNIMHVLSLEVTSEAIYLSGYWATQSKDGEVSYLGMVLDGWLPIFDPQFKIAHRCLRASLKWVRSQAFEWIRSDLANLKMPDPVRRPRSAKSGRTSPGRAGSWVDVEASKQGAHENRADDE